MHDSESNYYRDYETLIAPIRDQMIRVVWQVTQDEEDAEEAMQEALAVLWRKFDRVCTHDNPQALVLRICHNAAYDVLRRKIRRRKRQEFFQQFLPRGKASRPDHIVAGREQESIILRAIAQLSRQQSVAVLLRLVQERSYTEIAEILGCTEVTARKHVARGRERLRERLPRMLDLRPEELPAEGRGR